MAYIFQPFFEDKIFIREHSLDESSFSVHGTNVFLRYSSQKPMSLAEFVENSVNVLNRHKEQSDIFCLASMTYNDRIKDFGGQWECIIYMRYSRTVAFNEPKYYRIFDFQGIHPQFLKAGGSSIRLGAKFVVKYLSQEILNNPRKFEASFYCSDYNKFEEIRKKF